MDSKKEGAEKKVVFQNISFGGEELPDIPPIEVILGNVPSPNRRHSKILYEKEKETQLPIRDLVNNYLETKTCLLKSQSASTMQHLEKECKIVCIIVLENIFSRMERGCYVKLLEINSKEHLRNSTLKRQFFRISKRRREIEIAEDNPLSSPQSNISHISFVFFSSKITQL